MFSGREHLSNSLCAGVSKLMFGVGKMRKFPSEGSPNFVLFFVKGSVVISICRKNEEEKELEV